jgi:PAS domain S-box-containing protein
VDAEIILDNGTLLAGYHAGTNTATAFVQLKAEGVYLDGRNLELVRRLPGDARLRLVMDLNELRHLSQLTLRAFGAGVLTLICITASLLVALQRIIVRPVTALAEAAEQVRTHADYTRRVPATGSDEVARLGQSFNAMMAAVQQRENDLHHLNQFHRTILDNAAHCIISTTPEGVVTSFNLAAERLLGYKAGEVVGQQTPALWHDPEEVARRAQQLSGELGVRIAPGFEVFTARAGRGLTEEGEWTFVRKDAARVPVFLSVTALRDEQGQISGYVGLFSDISERLRTQEALRKLNEELEQRVKERTAELEESRRALINLVEDLNEKAAVLETTNNTLAAVNKELEAFSYSVSHDLRAPLRAIDGFSRILLEEFDAKLDEDGREHLRRVRAASQRMGHLIDDMLKLSRLTRSELHRQHLDLSAMAAGIIADLQKTEPERQVAFVLEPRLTAQGDAHLIQIMMENLLGNAWKFSSRQKQSQIEFGVKQDGQETAFFVRDNGAGFDMAYADKLFGAFQRLHSTTDFPGTGIGLATVQRIVHRHGGRVWAESKPGLGATFYFTLSAT